MSNTRYVLRHRIIYYSPRYKKRVVLNKGYSSDGASGAIDIDGPVKCFDMKLGKWVKKSLSWWVHDKLCDTMEWDDGTHCSNFQSSMVLKDILRSEGHWVRDHWWFLSTWIFRTIKTRQG